MNSKEKQYVSDFNISLVDLGAFHGSMTELFLKGCPEADRNFAKTPISEYVGKFVLRADNFTKHFYRAAADIRRAENNACSTDSNTRPYNQHVVPPPPIISLSSTTNGVSSAGKIRSTPSRPTLLRAMKVVPIQDEKSTALSILNAPKASTLITSYNQDLDTENATTIAMDNIVQLYSKTDDDMIMSSLGLLTGMKMKGAIPFKNFWTTFFMQKFMKGFYNQKEGDIYALSSFTCRADHSRVRVRQRGAKRRDGDATITIVSY